MLELKARAFYESALALNNIGRYVKRKIEGGDNPAISAGSDIDADTVFYLIGQVNALTEHLGILEATFPLLVANRLLGNLRDGVETYAGLELKLADLDSRLRDHLGLCKLFVLEADRQKYFEPPEPLFGQAFSNNFNTKGTFELDEAAKCFAFGRPTAAVFHLMRVLEVGIGALRESLGIPDPLKPAERNWGFILGAIETGIKAKWPTSATRMSGDGALFEEFHASLDAVKNPWRNTTMHVENKYTDDEAEHIFVAVKGFMKKLASRMDENGNPRA